MTLSRRITKLEGAVRTAASHVVTSWGDYARLHAEGVCASPLLAFNRQAPEGKPDDLPATYADLLAAGVIEETPAFATERERGGPAGSDSRWGSPLVHFNRPAPPDPREGETATTNP